MWCVIGVQTDPHCQGASDPEAECFCVKPDNSFCAFTTQGTNPILVANVLENSGARISCRSASAPCSMLPHVCLSSHLFVDAQSRARKRVAQARF